MDMNNLERGLQKMREFTQKNKFIIASYIFGSAAKRKMGRLSDIDLAFYLEETGREDISRKELLLMNKAVNIFGTEAIDIVIMNSSRNSLNFNIIKGNLIASNDEDKRVKFETKIINEYLDNDYHEKLMAQIGLNRIASRGLS